MKQLAQVTNREDAINRFKHDLTGPSGPCDYWNYKFKTNQYWYRIISKAFNFFARRMWRIEVKGIENIPDKNVVFMPNHVSHLDGPLLASYYKRAPVVIGDEKLFRARWFSKFGQMTNIFPVRKGTKSIALIDYAISRVNGGDSFLIFPEGQRHKNASLNKCNPGKLGAGKMAHAINAPVIPVFINGAEFAMALGRSMSSGCGPRTIKITITFGKPVDLDDIRRLEPSKETSQLAIDRVMEAIEELRPSGPYMVQKTRKWQKPTFQMFKKINNIPSHS